MNVIKFLANLIFKKQIQKQKGIMKILPGDKVDAEKKAKTAIKKLQENANINVNKLTESDLEFIAEDIVNPFKYAEKTPIKSADILPFRFKRSFAEELADASKKGDFTRMSGIMKLDPKFKEVMKAFNKSKADEKAYKKMVGPKKLIPDRDVIPYQSPEVQKLSPKEKLARTTLTEDQYKDVLKKGYGIDDVIYAQDFYGDTAEDVIRRAAEKGTPVAFAGGGVAGLLGERQNFAMGRRAFLKLMGSVGAGIGAAKAGLGSLFKAGKPVTKAAEVITTPNAPGKPEWFDALVTKVIREGDDVTKKFATKERELVHTKQINEFAEVTVYRDLDTNTVRVNYGSKLRTDPTKPYEKGNISRAVNDSDQIDLIVKGPEDIEPTLITNREGFVQRRGTKTDAEFEAYESEPRVANQDGDIEFDGERVVNNVDDLMEDVSPLEEYATGKKLTGDKAAKAQKKQDDYQRFTEDPVEQANYLEEKYGPAPEPDDYASGGVARLLGE